MKQTETLIDAVYRETFNKKSILPSLTERPLADLRRALLGARRFVADASMSEFLADISNVPFASVKHQRRADVMNSLRHGALLPADKVWIEYLGVPFKKRMTELSVIFIDSMQLSVDDVEESACPRIGWLLERDAHDDAQVRMTEFACDEQGIDHVVVFPWRTIWNARDVPVPGNDAINFFAHGIFNLKTPSIGIELEPCLANNDRVLTRVVNFPDGTKQRVPMLLVDFTGSARYAMALLSTLNEIPKTVREVKNPRGSFLGGGQIRKFLDHEVVTLNLPVGANRYKVAKRLVAQAVRRRRHEVRPFWKRIPAVGDGPFCPPGECIWSEMDESRHASCKACGARRIWVEKHERGDASLGYVVHSYNLTHRERRT